MNTLPDRPLCDCRIVLVGTGGVGAPCAIALAEAGVGELLLVDDDRVEIENLHRQLLFDDGDVGASKPEAARRSLERRRDTLRARAFEGRALPAGGRSSPAAPGC